MAWPMDRRETDRERRMNKITYEVVEHDGGWAYRVDGVFSEPFPTHADAHRAAERVAREQLVPGETAAISYEDKEGHWHDEVAPGDDRPVTAVADRGESSNAGTRPARTRNRRPRGRRELP
jgi:uncharacterized protein DUF2188